MRHREPAICLRTTDYSETSQVVRFLTRGCGVARLLAKGAKRPKSKSGGAIDLLAEGQLVFISPPHAGLGTLIEFTQTELRTAIRSDASRLNTALYLVELADEMLTESDPHPEVFDLLHNGLSRLGETGSPAAVLAYFQWRLLRHVGLLGAMDLCVSCGRALADVGRKNVHFSTGRGGLLCGACEGAAAEKYRLDGAALAGLAALAAAEAGARVVLPDAQARSVNRLLAYHISGQLGRPLKMAAHAIG